MGTLESATREQLARWRRAGGRLRVLKLGGSLLDWAEWPKALRAWRAQGGVQSGSASDASGVYDLIVVGGGVWCDALRESDRRFGLGDEFCHRACLELMALTARLVWRVLAGAPTQFEPGHFEPAGAALASTLGWLSDVEFISASSGGSVPDVSAPVVSAPVASAPESSTSVYCTSGASTSVAGLGEQSCLAARRPGAWAVVDAGRWLATRDGTAGGELPASWDVTSDSIAAWVAGEVGAEELVLFKSLSADGSGAIAEWSERGWIDAFFPRMAARLRGCSIRLVGLREVGRGRDLFGSDLPEGGSPPKPPRVS